MHRFSVLGAVVVAATIATGASATESTIVPNVQIGKVRLGMTLAQVKKQLGSPQVTNARTQIRGRGYVEYGWDFSTFWVGFVNRKGVLRVALIGTDIVGQKTKDGVGIGTPIAKLRARYRVACNTYPGGEIPYLNFYEDPGQRVYSYCQLGPRNAPTTIFGLKCTNFRSTRNPPCTDYAVNRVVVRESVLRD